MNTHLRTFLICWLALFLLEGCKDSPAEKNPRPNPGEPTEKTGLSATSPQGLTKGVEEPPAPVEDTMIAYYEAATVYAAATDYAFIDDQGARQMVRVSNIPEEASITLPKGLLDPEETEGPPGANPKMTGRPFMLTHNAAGEVTSVSAVNPRDELEDFLLPGHEILDFQYGDLNLDNRPDVLLVQKAVDEESTSDVDRPTPRPLMILIRQADHHLKLAAQNERSVLCVNCGGIFGDPYSGLVIKGGYFSVEHYGGSNWRWTKIITYKYNPKDKKWYLHRDGGENYHTGDPEGTKTTEVKTTADFGVVPFEDYNINENF